MLLLISVRLDGKVSDKVASTKNTTLVSASASLNGFVLSHVPVTKTKRRRKWCYQCEHVHCSHSAVAGTAPGSGCRNS